MEYVVIGGSTYSPSDPIAKQLIADGNNYAKFEQLGNSPNPDSDLLLTSYGWSSGSSVPKEESIRVAIEEMANPTPHNVGYVPPIQSTPIQVATPISAQSLTPSNVEIIGGNARITYSNGISETISFNDAYSKAQSNQLLMSPLLNALDRWNIQQNQISAVARVAATPTPAPISSPIATPIPGGIFGNIVNQAVANAPTTSSNKIIAGLGIGTASSSDVISSISGNFIRLIPIPGAIITPTKTVDIIGNVNSQIVNKPTGFAGILAAVKEHNEIAQANVIPVVTVSGIFGSLPSKAITNAKVEPLIPTAKSGLLSMVKTIVENRKEETPIIQASLIPTRAELNAAIESGNITISPSKSVVIPPAPFAPTSAGLSAYKRSYGVDVARQQYLNEQSEINDIIANGTGVDISAVSSAADAINNANDQIDTLINNFDSKWNKFSSNGSFSGTDEEYQQYLSEYDALNNSITNIDSSVSNNREIVNAYNEKISSLSPYIKSDGSIDVAAALSAGVPIRTLAIAGVDPLQAHYMTLAKQYTDANGNIDINAMTSDSRLGAVGKVAAIGLTSGTENPYKLSVGRSTVQMTPDEFKEEVMRIAGQRGVSTAGGLFNLENLKNIAPIAEEVGQQEQARLERANEIFQVAPHFKMSEESGITGVFGRGSERITQALESTPVLNNRFVAGAIENIFAPIQVSKHWEEKGAASWGTYLPFAGTTFGTTGLYWKESTTLDKVLGIGSGIAIFGAPAIGKGLSSLAGSKVGTTIIGGLSKVETGIMSSPIGGTIRSIGTVTKGIGDIGHALVAGKYSPVNWTITEPMHAIAGAVEPRLAGLPGIGRFGEVTGAWRSITTPNLVSAYQIKMQGLNPSVTETRTAISNIVGKETTISGKSFVTKTPGVTKISTEGQQLGFDLRAGGEVKVEPLATVTRAGEALKEATVSVRQATNIARSAGNARETLIKAQNRLNKTDMSSPNYARVASDVQIAKVASEAADNQFIRAIGNLKSPEGLANMQRLAKWPTKGGDLRSSLEGYIKAKNVEAQSTLSVEKQAIRLSDATRNIEGAQSALNRLKISGASARQISRAERNLRNANSALVNEQKAYNIALARVKGTRIVGGLESSQTKLAQAYERLTSKLQPRVNWGGSPIAFTSGQITGSTGASIYRIISGARGNAPTFERIAGNKPEEGNIVTGYGESGFSEVGGFRYTTHNLRDIIGVKGGGGEGVELPYGRTVVGQLEPDFLKGYRVRGESGFTSSELQGGIIRTGKEIEVGLGRVRGETKLGSSLIPEKWTESGGVYRGVSTTRVKPEIWEPKTGGRVLVGKSPTVRENIAYPVPRVIPGIGVIENVKPIISPNIAPEINPVKIPGAFPFKSPDINPMKTPVEVPIINPLTAPETKPVTIPGTKTSPAPLTIPGIGIETKPSTQPFEKPMEEVSPTIEEQTQVETIPETMVETVPAEETVTEIETSTLNEIFNVTSIAPITGFTPPEEVTPPFTDTPPEKVPPPIVPIIPGGGLVMHGGGGGSMGSDNLLKRILGRKSGLMVVMPTMSFDSKMIKAIVSGGEISASSGKKIVGRSREYKIYKPVAAESGVTTMKTKKK